jgi:tellurite resistance protein TerC
MIVLGAAFVARFDWAMYVFGGILIFSAIKMLKESDESEDFKQSLGVRLLGKIYPIDWSINSGKYLERVNGKIVATSLFAALVVVEFSDILFAIDSIPAIFSVTKEPFIVFTSNIFAILGLRNLYFFLANMLDKFKYMKFALVFVLLFVGVKMIFHHYLEFLNENTWISLVVILGSLILGVLVSMLPNRKDQAS